MKYEVAVNWDEEAGAWFAICDEIPLALGSNSFDALILKTKIVAQEILEINGTLCDDVKLCFITNHLESIA